MFLHLITILQLILTPKGTLFKFSFTVKSFCNCRRYTFCTFPQYFLSDTDTDTEKCLLVYFLPTSMFTITSWFSFLLPPKSYPARTSLLVTIFLCQIGIFNAVVLDTPNENGGLTALEVWVLCNIGLVFFTFLAYVVLLARIRLETIRIVAPQKKKMDPRKEDEMQTTALEIGLFLAVVLVTLVFLVVFFVVYLINNG